MADFQICISVPLIQYKNLKNEILAAFDIFGVLTQFKFYNSVKTRDV